MLAPIAVYGLRRPRVDRRGAPLREIVTAGAPLWPASSGSEYVETLACGHYRRCRVRCTAQAHRCALCPRQP